MCRDERSEVASVHTRVEEQKWGRQTSLFPTEAPPVTSNHEARVMFVTKWDWSLLSGMLRWCLQIIILGWGIIRMLCEKHAVYNVSCTRKKNIKHCCSWVRTEVDSMFMIIVMRS